jgi:hypothetical protein
MYPKGPDTTPCPDWELFEDDGLFLKDEDEINGEQVLAQVDLQETHAHKIAVMFHP